MISWYLEIQKSKSEKFGKFLFKFKLYQVWDINPHDKIHTSRVKKRTETITHVIQPKNNDPKPKQFCLNNLVFEYFLPEFFLSQFATSFC